MLDSQRQYTCGYWTHGIRTLEQAPQNLQIPEDAAMRILDIGRGWGGLAHAISGVERYTTDEWLGSDHFGVWLGWIGTYHFRRRAIHNGRVAGPAVGNSPHFSNESPFQTILQNCQPRIQVEILEEMSEMEIRSKKGASCRRLH
jgi:hypothetical protein